MSLSVWFQQRKELQPYALGGAVALIGCLAYLGILNNGFVNWDDDLYIYENRLILSLGPDSLVQFFTGFHAGNWHPVAWLSHALDYALWGLNPFGHHLTSLILHGLNTALIVVLMTRLIQAAGRQMPHREFFSGDEVLTAASVTGLFFGLHPIHVESVAWASERKDLLYAFFYQLSVLCYIRHVSIGGRAGEYSEAVPRLSKGFGVASLVFFALSLMSKPMALTLPAVLLILDWYPLGRFDGKASPHRIVIEKVPYILLSAVSAILTLAAQRTAHYVISLQSMPLSDRVLFSLYGLTAYVGKILWPDPLRPFYPTPAEASFHAIKFLLPAVIVSVLAIAAVIQAGKQKVWLALGLFYCITLFPVLGIVKAGLQIIADRYAYLASVGPFLAAGLCVALLLRYGRLHKRKTAGMLLVIVAVLSCLLAFVTVQQVRIWKDGISFWSSILEQGTTGRVSANRQELQLFSGALTQADAWMVTSHHNRAKAYAAAGQYPEAEQDLNIAVAMGNAIAGYPNEINLFYRGYVFLKASRLAEAERDFSRALTLKQDYAEAYYLRGVARMNGGNTLESIEDLTRAVAVSSSPPYNYYHDRGLAFARIGRHDSAVADYTEALRLNPASKRTYLSRARSYYNLNLFQQARDDLKKVQALP
ncbi:MAG: tetratricopeptide repeat protein [Nitrospirae bacterium]|nr:tetratricopeptide repeat protein [Nitrospirota bacterium]